MNCTRCDATGFINTEYLPIGWEDWELEDVVLYIDAHLECDAGICDCCGDGECWYGTPGLHTSTDSRRGSCG